MPALSSCGIAAKAAYDLTMVLAKPHPTAPFLPHNSQHVAELQHLARIFQEMANPKPTTADLPAVPSPRVFVPTPTSTVVQTANTAQMDADVSRHEINNVVQNAVPANIPLQRINAVFDADSGMDLEYRQLIRHPKHKTTWLTSSANKFGRLAQGIRDITGSDTITFISNDQIPKGGTATHGRFVCDIRPQKAEKARTRLTV